MDYKDLILTSLETMDLFDPVTGAYLFTLDELQSATIAQTEESNDVTGRNGRVLATLKRNKSITISGNNGLISGGLMELQTGGTFESKTTLVKWTDYMAVESNGATTAYKAVGSTGNEISAVYVKAMDGTLGQKYTQAATAGEGTFAYDPTTKAITFATGALADGTEIVAFYDRNILASNLVNSSTGYSKTASAYINAIAEDKCANVYRVQFYCPKVAFNGNFSIELGGTQVVHAFEARTLVGGSCGTGLNDGVLWTYTVFGANAEDAE